MIELWSYPHPLINDVPLVYQQYIQFLKGVIKNWDWGYTIKQKEIWSLFKEKVPITLKVNIIAFFIYIPIGILLGIFSAIKKNSIYDHIIGIFTLIFSSIPSFVLIFILIYFLGFQFKWFPPQYPAEIHGYTMRMKGLVIPILALSAGPIAELTRLVRGELVEDFQSDYFLMLKTKGLNRRQAIFRHALRNCMVPVIPAILSSFIYVLCGSFIIELIYGIPGIARQFLDSIFVKLGSEYRIIIDTNRLVLIAGFYTSISLVFGLIIDILYGILDPRIRIGSKK